MIGCVLTLGPSTPNSGLQGQVSTGSQGQVWQAVAVPGQMVPIGIGGVRECEPPPQPTPIQPSMGQAEQVEGRNAQSIIVVVSNNGASASRRKSIRLQASR